ncbi:MAG: aminopeptidase N [Magnetococcales bacterium]|nr:aminopeptidase N [Magnetococcales bacterium]
MSSLKSKKVNYLKDYRPYSFLVEQVDLTFELGLDVTTVHAKIAFSRQPSLSKTVLEPLVLQGRELKLLSISLDGTPLDLDQYQLTEETLTIPLCPERFFLETSVMIYPQANTSLEGLFASGQKLCTQCEAEGFRKITFFPDRPDVLAPYTTRLIGDCRLFPSLLSNGNLIESGQLKGGRHYALWRDPFLKPSYLFAVVAGNLVCQEDFFTTASGRVVTLQIFVEERNKNKCAHALCSLKKSMAWDEKRYGLEYDLDIYMVVAVDDFNMGAMENKGLNLFNAKYVLAEPKSATDTDYQLIEAVIGHEYFHNWTGNRVTCRDWFQLSLKEGLTVFREHEFSGESISPEVQRIQDVMLLRSNQFPEDAGPTAHPVQPSSYLEINNFYTLTIYEKGAELIGMLKTLLGNALYHQGIDLYLRRHDGQAATVDDFIAAMASVSGRNLSQFKRWYEQAGTPILTIDGVHDPQTMQYTLDVRQQCPDTPGQTDKKPFHIPLTLGLLDQTGQPFPLCLEGESSEQSACFERTLELTQVEHRFVFTGIDSPPIPSLLRVFSAPVRLQANLSDRDLAFLWSHDSDAFNRWEGGQELASRLLLPKIESDADLFEETDPRLDYFIEAFLQTLTDKTLSAAPKALALTLPSERILFDRIKRVNPQRIHQVRTGLQRMLANRLENDFLQVWQSYAEAKPYRFTQEEVGQRSLKNLCLSYLLYSDNPTYRQLAVDCFYAADNMTDQLGALSPLCRESSPESDEVMKAFESQWYDEPLVMDKWFFLQATAPRPETLQTVEQLMKHPLFTLKTPNRVRALIGGFSQTNPFSFHDADGNGYRFLADQILLLDGINPQIAARLLSAMSQWKRLEENRSGLMQSSLQRIANSANLSRDVYEIVTKILS